MKRKREFDKYSWYVKTVQDPEGTVEFLEQAYRDLRKAKPKVMREDFCATFAIACAWVSRHESYKAWGVDKDPEPILWGIKNHFTRLSPSQQKRLVIVEDDVLSPRVPTADVIAALNFSYFIFKERQQMLAYFKNCRRTLRPKGILVLDCFGGYGTMEANEEHTKYRTYTYSWDQHSFDPITAHSTFYIHFKLKGEGKRRERVFTYDWRMWTIAEIQDLLAEAGFKRSHVYWEKEDAKGKTNNEYARAVKATNCPAWVNYIVGEK